MRLSDFDYALPKELIAQYPLEERDAARLLVLDRGEGTISHRVFKEITDYLKPADLLVLNDTKVLPSRLVGSRLTGGKVEILLLRQKSALTFEALIKPARVRINEKIIFNGGKVCCEVSSRNEVVFSGLNAEAVYDLGVMPLPPYIKRDPEESDRVYYQTVYALRDGSIAAPTAGLHFTDGLLEKIKTKMVETAYITLHVGYATFKPVKCEDIAEHRMQKEYFSIGREAQRKIAVARLENRRIIAVGTTSCRSLETFASGINEGFTDLFIYPGYDFKMTGCLLTNFHLPRTTLFMLTCAFAGEKLAKEAYRQAVDKKYRFYSYGDAMLIL
ncbi:MAG: tRNA preQ1(34) S-adenosylmethionine ribosyltransferase-isomerase QueA [Candidatus Omnitrophica bacterium]|nr:tRNA preQ1(34) S-adenosylmethionine ribosyltransferase-isomerase QueA [Candidatus Omnitrophota bacterium]MDD5553734.1 tRNA preQ1(34) S-adenosylmethionine ribosyltransferase-isomerase QueA [Candidatus Omnitrophota bacterium]